MSRQAHTALKAEERTGILTCSQVKHLLIEHQTEKNSIRNNTTQTSTTRFVSSIKFTWNDFVELHINRHGPFGLNGEPSSREYGKCKQVRQPNQTFIERIVQTLSTEKQKQLQTMFALNIYILHSAFKRVKPECRWGEAKQPRPETEHMFVCGGRGRDSTKPVLHNLQDR